MHLGLRIASSSRNLVLSLENVWCMVAEVARKVLGYVRHLGIEHATLQLCNAQHFHSSICRHSAIFSPSHPASLQATRTGHGNIDNVGSTAFRHRLPQATRHSSPWISEIYWNTCEIKENTWIHKKHFKSLKSNENHGKWYWDPWKLCKR